MNLFNSHLKIKSLFFLNIPTKMKNYFFILKYPTIEKTIYIYNPIKILNTSKNNAKQSDLYFR